MAIKMEQIKLEGENVGDVIEEHEIESLEIY